MIKKSFEELTPNIKRGINGCPKGHEIEIEDEIGFLESSSIWVIPFTISLQEKSEFVSQKTSWYCLIDDSYPLGDIDIYPSKEGGIVSTFPHQNLNHSGSNSYPWRAGKLCLDGPFSKKVGNNSADPYGNAEDRLRWHLYRSLIWTTNAINNNLMAAGDPFELPQYPLPSKESLGGIVVYESSRTSLGSWDNAGIYGTVKISNISGLSGVSCLEFFKNDNSTLIQSFSGRIEPLPNGINTNALWILWPKTFVVPPWKAPTTWGEVRDFAHSCKIDIDHILKDFAEKIRDKNPAVIVFGYRIPLHAEKQFEEIHWKAIQLPRLKKKAMNGFRDNEAGWWANDKKNNFNYNNIIQYLDTQNFDQKRLQVRGVLPDYLRTKKIAMIGVGALGSMILDSIVRGGVTDLLLIDPDLLSAGNVCRHVLTLNEINKPKVEGVKYLLEQISPYVKVETFKEYLPTDLATLKSLLLGYDVIIDCTGSNEVLETLAKVHWPIPKYFFSFSLSWGATALFSFSSFSNKISSEKFNEEIKPYLSEYPVEDGVIEGAGCWSPLFPARHDSVMYASCLCVKDLTSLTTLILGTDSFHKRDIPQ